MAKTRKEIEEQMNNYYPEKTKDNQANDIFDKDGNVTEKAKSKIDYKIGGMSIPQQEGETEINIDFSKNWFCCCSYFQQHAKERNIINILVKQDQFPTLKEVQEALEEKVGFAVEDVVLMNWKEVEKDYQI